ncbi:hypothetical protein HDV05_006825 [Chytridiales sp. JEL 0842]|nr:hypothetical protein HDV05_006825 [Chytridiales sp. JEL 0842]
MSIPEVTLSGGCHTLTATFQLVEPSSGFTPPPLNLSGCRLQCFNSQAARERGTLIGTSLQYDFTNQRVLCQCVVDTRQNATDVPFAEPAFADYPTGKPCELCVDFSRIVETRDPGFRADQCGRVGESNLAPTFYYYPNPGVRSLTAPVVSKVLLLEDFVADHCNVVQIAPSPAPTSSFNDPTANDPAGASNGGTGSSTPSTPSAPSASNSNSSNNNLPIILGASIGSAAFILLALTISFFVLRSRRRHRQNESHNTKPANKPHHPKGGYISSQPSDATLNVSASTGQQFETPVYKPGSSEMVVVDTTLAPSNPPRLGSFGKGFEEPLVVFGNSVPPSVPAKDLNDPALKSTTDPSYASWKLNVGTDPYTHPQHQTHHHQPIRSQTTFERTAHAPAAVGMERTHSMPRSPAVESHTPFFRSETIRDQRKGSVDHASVGYEYHEEEEEEEEDGRLREPVE